MRRFPNLGRKSLAGFGRRYAIAGWPAVRALATRTQGATSDNFYQLIYRPFRYMASATSAPAGLMIAVAILVACMRRSPCGGFRALPTSSACRPSGPRWR